MTTLQLYLAIALPTLAALTGIIVNLVQFSSLSARMTALENKFDTRFDLLIGKLMEVDTRLTRVEERIQRRDH